jgi:hypothetical protein
MAANWVGVPNLVELKIHQVKRNPTEDWRTLFERAPTVTKLSIPAKSGCFKLLCETPNIRHLTLNAEGSTGYGWLRQLAEKEAESYISHLIVPILPNLRTLTIRLGKSVPDDSAFETFTRSRCIPIDEERYTATGCRALELLTLRIWHLYTSSVEMLDNYAWGGTEVEKSIGREKNVEFRFRWPSIQPSTT